MSKDTYQNQELNEMVNDLGGDAVKTILDSVQRNLDTYVSDIAVALTKGDLPTARFGAHRLISSCLAIGAWPMRNLCKRIEDLAAAPNGTTELNQTDRDGYKNQLQEEVVRMREFIVSFQKTL